MTGLGLLKQLKLEFNDSALLDRALTHRSCGVPHNERLEFLGDAVLQLIISAWLCQHFADADEGHLSWVRADWVSGVSLAALSRQLGVDSALRVEGSVQEITDSMAANALEALIGAMFLDGGLAYASEQVQAWFAPQLAALPPELPLRKDAKSLLQEHQQSCARPLPEYELTGQDAHAHFRVRCRVAGEEATGVARTRRQAEQQAAAMLLERLVATVPP